MREHRVGMLTWIIGGGVFNWFETYALHVEMADFPGGTQRLAASVLPAAEAMRPLRWPAERLDTLSGYLTYHNLLMFQGFLAIYAAVQGVHLIRRPEEQHSLEQVLATGWSRLAYLRDRAIGLIITLALITLGLASSVAASLVWVGEPATVPAFAAHLAMGLCALVAFGAGLLAGQLFRSARSAIGTSVITLVVLYILTNEWENLGLLGLLRYVSPFFFANDGRALVPGVAFQWTSMLILFLMAVVLVGAAVPAFLRRDYGNALWWRPERQAHAVRAVRPQRWWLARLWRAQLVRHRIALLAWALPTAAFSVLWMGLVQTVSRSWAMSDFFTAFLGGAPGVSMTAMYVSFGCDALAAVVLAYAVSQASGWVSDLQERRVEALLSAPLSWRRLMGERLIAVAAGVAVVATAWIAAGSVMARFVDAEVDVAGFARTFVLCLLIGSAGAALAAVLAVLTRNTWATTGLIIYIVIAYVLGWFVSILHWPAWLSRMSVFEAYGHPYREWPDASNLLILSGVALFGTLAAMVIAERTPKVP